MGVFDVDNLEVFHLPIEGKIVAVEEMESLNLFFVLAKLNGKFNVYILEDLSNLIGSFYFIANNSFILVDDNTLYTGADTTITKTEVAR